MATYAIGDIQGCLAPLQRLLRRIGFNPKQDRLWLAGDLVNRGPDSLGVLRWARDLGDAARVVLGNHDLRLLGIAHGVKTLRPSDTLADVLAAPDAAELLNFLQSRPLLVQAGPWAMVHAGVLPSWSLADAVAHARSVEKALQGSQSVAFLRRLGTEVPNRWEALTDPLDRLVFITKVLTYLRVCTADGTLHLDFTGPPQAAPAGCMPWFAVPQRKSRDVRWVCGHWSALGLHQGDGIWALDTGCVWGGALTALRLEDQALFREPAR